MDPQLGLDSIDHDPRTDQETPAMGCFNLVRFRVKPGRDQEFLDAHKNVEADWPGVTKVNMTKISDRTYCIIAEWSDRAALSTARPNMVATLNSFRDMLEDFGGGLGVTDLASGPGSGIEVAD
jgi:hypothetical protein